MQQERQIEKDAIGFIEYHDKFRSEEKRLARQGYEKAGGMFTWVCKDIKDVYDNYISKKPIESYLIPDITTFWEFNAAGKLIHSVEEGGSQSGKQETEKS